MKDEDFSLEEIEYEAPVNLHHSSLIQNFLTITEENEEELEQLKRDDDDEQQQQQHTDELLSEVYCDAPSPLLFDDDDDDDDDDEDDEIKQFDDDVDSEDSSMMNHLLFNHSEHRSEYVERLSTIYESPSPQLHTDEHADDDEKLIVYDVADVEEAKEVNRTLSHCFVTVRLSSSYRPLVSTRNQR